jgi:CMP-N-acetylneuraminic acid synthetase
MDVAIITARAGSTSINNKNVMNIAGKPLVSYPVKAAMEAEMVSESYTSTNGKKIASIAKEHGSSIIWRPKHLHGDGGHGKVIEHAAEKAEERVGNVDNIAVLLGNTTMVDASLIDQALKILQSRPEVDSVMSVWKAADDHPVRALKANDNGYLEAYDEVNENEETDRKTYDDAFFYDQGVWAFRKECVRNQEGPGPWWWMGKNCVPIVRTWSTGRDIHNYFDARIHEFYEVNREEMRSLEKRLVWEDYVEEK